MRRDWDLIRGLLSAIDVDYDLNRRHELIGELVVLKGIRPINYHLTLLFEAKLVRYFRPLYSELTKQLEPEPIQLTSEGIELLTLMRSSDSAWKAVTLTLDYGGSISASQDVLASALKKYFLSAEIAA
jgi:Hypothetical protein (DUF2513)